MNLVLISRAIYPLHGYGGLERHCYDWILTMTELGCTVNVITMPPREFYSDFPTSVRFHFIPGNPATKVKSRITEYPRWVKRVGAYLSNYLKQENVDAIYAHGLSVAGCAGLSTPIFYNPHGMEEFKTNGLKYLAYASFRSMSRVGAKAATKVIATDKSLVSEIRKFLEVSDEKIAVIPNSVRLLAGAGLVPASQESTHPLFLAVGRLERNKGFHILLHALAQSKDLPQKWKLKIAGTGSMKYELQRLARSLKIEEHVVFVGKIKPDEMAALYESADLFIHPTLYEGSSIVTLEAMMHELPVIATTAGGLPDKIQPNVNGWLVPPGDSDALSKAIIHACSVLNQWQEMGKASLSIVREHFSWERSGKLFLELMHSR